MWDAGEPRWSRSRRAAGVAAFLVALSACASEGPVGASSHPKPVPQGWIEIDETYPTMVGDIGHGFGDRFAGIWTDLDGPTRAQQRVVQVSPLRDEDRATLDRITSPMSERYRLMEVTYSFRQLRVFACRGVAELKDEPGFRGWDQFPPRNRIVFVGLDVDEWEQRLLDVGLPADAFLVRDESPGEKPVGLVPVLSQLGYPCEPPASYRL